MSLYDDMKAHYTQYGGMSCPLAQWMERVKYLEGYLAELDHRLTKKPCQYGRCLEWNKQARNARRYQWFIDHRFEDGPTGVDAKDILDYYPTSQWDERIDDDIEAGG